MTPTSSSPVLVLQRSKRASAASPDSRFEVDGAIAWANTPWYYCFDCAARLHHIASPTSIDSGSGGDESAHQAAPTCQPPQITIVGYVQVQNSNRDQAFWCCCQKRSRTPAPSVFLEPHHATFHRRSVRGFEDWAMRCLSGQGMRYVL